MEDCLNLCSSLLLAIDFFGRLVCRAVAQYLKRQSPVTPSSDDRSEYLTLNKILKGKTRKICARMFFETLVIVSDLFFKLETVSNVTVCSSTGLGKHINSLNGMQIWIFTG